MPDELHQPHNWLFKNSLHDPEHAASVFKSVLPARLVELIDWSTLELDTPEKVTFVVGSGDLRFRVSAQGIEAKLFVVYEHQSSTDKHMAFRLLRYMVGVWSDAYDVAPSKPLPPILPIVLHHSESGWTASVSFLDEIELTPELGQLLAPHLPGFCFILDDLSKRTDEQFQKQALTALARATFLSLARLRGATQVEIFFGYFQQTLLEVLKAPNGLDALNRVLRYAVQVSEIDLEKLRPYILNTFGRSAEETVMTTAEKLRQQGLQQGIERGLQQGIERGRVERARELIRKQLSLKFGILSSAALECLEHASEAELDRYAERLLSANTLEEVLS